MANAREEAAPTFNTWKTRLERAHDERRPREVSQFLQILKTLGTPMIDGAEVNFIYYGPQAKQVSVVGEFNQWGRGEAIAMTPLDSTGFFYHTLRVPEPARLEYKLIVDGEWETDPLCPHTVNNGVGGSNSYFVVGEFKEPPELQVRSDIAHGVVEQFEFSSRLLRNTRRVYVYLPPGYDDAPKRRFASMYVHDGGEYLERAKLANVLDNLLASGEIPPLVTVMVDPVNRMEEYWANAGYIRFLCEELLPELEPRYRAGGDRNGRGVMGASLGGLISVYAALSHPELFSRVAGQSSALHLAEDKLAPLMEQAGRGGFRFYFDVGQYEPRFIPAHQRFVAALKKKRWPTLYQELPGGHNWTSWRMHLKDLLVFLWQSAADKRPQPRAAKSSDGRRAVRKRTRR